MRRLPDTLKGFTAFIDGRGQAGIVDSGKLPVIKIKPEAHRDGGMDSEIDLDMGTEKMESELGFTEINRDILGVVGTRKPITLRGSLENESGRKVPIIASMIGLVTEADPGEWGVGKKSEVKLKLTPDYYKLTIGGVEIYEIDVINAVRRIDGVDQLAQRRQNLGL